MITRVSVNPDQKALVYKNGKLLDVLSAGKYWKRSNLEFEYLNATQPFHSKYDVDSLIANPIMANLLDVVEVKDSELAFQYLNGNFNQVLGRGRYAYWKGVKNYSYNVYDTSSLELPVTINKKLLTLPAILNQIRVYTVEAYEKGLLYLDGQFSKIVEPGIYQYWKNEVVVQLYKADLRVQQMEVSGQEILTKDKANIRINFYADYQIVDITKALMETKDSTKQFYTLMQLALREYIGRYTLDELLANKDEAKVYVIDAIAEKAAAMGIAIQNCGIRDIILPGDVKEIMNQVLVAEKKAQANVIMRREETASTRSLLNTAKLMEDNEMLYKLKEMEYVEKIAENISNITLSGGGQIVDQLKSIFAPVK
jgi:regulator of protease activity HflC (stomatin/prohibitin superfamily)